jgi:hypothetical protein
MTPVRLPPTLLPLVLRIASIDDHLFDKLLHAVNTMPSTVDRDTIVKHALQVCKDDNEDEVRASVEGSLGLRSIFDYQDLPEDDFISGLVVSLATSKDDAARNFNAERFSHRVARLLESESLAIRAKALQLLFESRRHIVGSRVLTDARPIFGEDATQAPLAAIITHTLRLQFHESEGSRELFFSFDTQDIASLIEALNRALEKDDSIRRYFANKGLPIIDSSPPRADK